MSQHDEVKIAAMNYAPDRPKAENPVKIQDLSLRDGYQSLFATRGRTEDMIPVAEMMDAVGFWALEIWGGATFDTMHRFLNEDPWQRLRTLKRYIRKTPVSMLLRAQNLVGYRNYPDDVARAFIERAVANGMDIFRTFDALNDYRNFEAVAPAIKSSGKHLQGCLCFSLTEPRMGGEVYTLDYYVKKAKELESIGADSICIKDMAGMIAPYDAYAIVKALKAVVSVPIHLHSHFTSGMASMAQLKAVEAGVDMLDTCLSPFAFRTSHPAVEPLVMALLGTSRDTGLDIRQLAAINEILEKDILPKYRHLLDDTKMSTIDINVLLHQTPGGMLSNLVNQLKEMNALDKLDAVFSELPRVRKDLGQIPLVTPTSQIVGIQTVNNVLFDDQNERYKMITAQVKDLCYGLYGKTAVPIDPALQKKALKGYKGGEIPITCRPAETLAPELEKAREAVKDLTGDIEDVLIYALYPVTGKRFLRWKYGKEAPPPETSPKTMDEVRAEAELNAKVKAGRFVEKPQKVIPPKGKNLRMFNVYVDDTYYEVGVEPVSARIETVATQNVAPGRIREEAKPALNLPQAPAPPQPAKKTQASKPKSKPDRTETGTPLEAPMPGMIVGFEKQAGDSVAEGETVAVLEAMKMENALAAPTAGIIKKVYFEPGDSVAKGDVLCIIE